MKFEITDAASMAIIEKASAKARLPELRVGIKGGGCSGYQYVLEFLDQPREDDFIFEHAGAKVYIDRKSIIFLNGTRLDYFSSMASSGFRFVNPNEKGSCGCGVSFSF